MNDVTAYERDGVTAFKDENDVIHTVKLRFYNLSLFHIKKSTYIIIIAKLRQPNY